MSVEVKTIVGVEDFKNERDSGDKVQISYNWGVRHDGDRQIFISVESEDGDVASIVLSSERGLEMLEHLNELLGKPMGYAAYAAG